MRPTWDRLEALSSKDAIRTDAARYSREYLINLLQWNDGNGCYTDKLAKSEGFSPLTKEQAIDMVVQVVVDSIWRHDDPRRKGWTGPKEWRPKRP